MKIKLLGTAPVAFAALSMGSAASAQVVQMSSPTTLSGSHATYVTGAGTIVADGYSAANTTTNLYAKTDGGLENGLGLAIDPQHEIPAPAIAFIQLNLSGLNAGTLVSFLMGSTTSPEGWEIYSSSTAGCGIGCGTLLTNGTNQGVFNPLTTTPDARYFDFYATGRAPNNVLLSELKLAAVPEPATWAMMLIGFGAIGFTMRRRRASGIPQIA